MKKTKLTITITSNEEWFQKVGIKMKSLIESGEAQKQFMTPRDIEEGTQDVEITFEELSL